MKLATAKLAALENGEDWSALSLVEKLQRLDTHEGHTIYESYYPKWTVALGRTWLSWAFGLSVTREVWNPQRLHIAAEFGPLCLTLVREWPASDA